jgi:transcriptional regulator with XRE-family HTH domain
MPAAKKLGENVRQLRIERNLTQEQVALEAGLRLSFVSDIERGKRNVSVETLLKLAKALNVDSAVILEGVELEEAEAPKATRH